MAEVKRYEHWQTGVTHQDPEGDYVRYSDHSSIVAALERRLRDVCDRYRELQAREVTNHDFECCIISAENFLESRVESEQKEQEERGKR